MLSAKETLQNILSSLPDDVSYEDLMEILYIHQSIDHGLNQLDNGEFLTQEQAEARLKKWLK
jgi:predicted transcriptional regulator